uniref:Pectate lyase superfamily protein domain-containing protein n=1 Tax=Physcomitrium patens TaxID=3218 RepID=A0A7I4EJC2_PHYPA
MRSLGLRNVVLFVCLLFLIAPGYSYRLSDALKSNLRVGDRNILRFSAQHGHLNPSRERAQLLQTSLWQQTKAMSAEEGRLRDKRNGVNSRVLYVTDYNADPSGQYDSTRALQTAINQAFNMATKHELLPGIPDLGGVEIHLEGGDYLISHPLRFPGKSGGNLVIHGGTLRATSNFPRDGYLIELWSSQSESLRANQTKSSLRERKGRSLPLSKEFVAYEDIIIRDLLLDGNFRGGGLLVVDSIRVTVENVTGIIAEDPLQLEITNNFLSGDANILLRATKKTHSISYLTITGNMFTGSSRGVPIVALDESAGRFTSVYDTLVDQNTAYGMALKATIARATLASSYTWRLNLNERLLFRDFIQNTQYSLYINGKDFPKHVLRSVKDNTVVVDADSRVSGTVSVLVDQSSDSLVLRSGSEVPVDTGAVGSKALFF